MVEARRGAESSPAGRGRGPCVLDRVEAELVAGTSVRPFLTPPPPANHMREHLRVMMQFIFFFFFFFCFFLRLSYVLLNMKSYLNVMSQEDFDKWLKSQSN